MDHGWHIGAGLEQAMHKNFLIVKGMTLMGEGGLKFKRFAANIATQAQYPSSAVWAIRLET